MMASLIDFQANVAHHRRYSVRWVGWLALIIDFLVRLK